jgi:malate synthase
MPDRGQVGMTAHFMRSYSKMVIRDCHRRNIHAMGGMSAFIPVKSDPEINEKAMAQVRADKEREATDGHDGTWVAHPGLVAIAKEPFDRLMPQPNQIDKKLPGFRVTAADLLQVPKGDITEAGLRQNLVVGMGYLESWLRGIGCVPLFHLMEDAATAEISRSQLWQWIRHGAHLKDGRKIDVALCDAILHEELAKAKASVPAGQYPSYDKAAELMRQMYILPTFVDFLTIPAYHELIRQERMRKAA